MKNRHSHQYGQVCYAFAVHIVYRVQYQKLWLEVDGLFDMGLRAAGLAMPC